MTVDGYGDITSSNAYQIYSDWKSGKVELSTAQQKYTERFLTQEQKDQIEYDTGNTSAKKTGADSIDSEYSTGSQTGYAAAGTAGNIVSLLVVLKIAEKLDGFSNLAASLVAMGFSVVQWALSKAFDTDYDDRTNASDSKDDTNAKLDEYSVGLGKTMDEMNKDMNAYQEGSTQMTTDINTNTSALADLQLQLADALAAGDTEGAKSLREQITQLQQADFSGQQDELDELGNKIQDYQDCNAEAMGASEKGTSVSDFLKVGAALGSVAMVNAALDLVVAAVCAFSASISWPKLPFAIDLSADVFSKTTKYAAASMFLAAAGMWGTKATKEFECHGSGTSIEAHVGDLNEMIDTQLGYIDTTTESFAETDEASAESQAKAQENANKAVGANTTGNGPTKDPNKKDDEPSNQGSGATVV